VNWKWPEELPDSACLRWAQESLYKIPSLNTFPERLQKGLTQEDPRSSESRLLKLNGLQDPAADEIANPRVLGVEDSSEVGHGSKAESPADQDWSPRIFRSFRAAELKQIEGQIGCLAYCRHRIGLCQKNAVTQRVPVLPKPRLGLKSWKAQAGGEICQDIYRSFPAALGVPREAQHVEVENDLDTHSGSTGLQLAAPCDEEESKLCTSFRFDHLPEEKEAEAPRRMGVRGSPQVTPLHTAVLYVLQMRTGFLLQILGETGKPLLGFLGDQDFGQRTVSIARW